MPRKKKEEVMEEEVVEVDVSEAGAETEETTDTESKIEVVDAENEDGMVVDESESPENDEISSSDADTNVPEEEIEAETEANPKSAKPATKNRRDVIAAKRQNEKLREARNIERESRLMAWEQIKNAHHERRIVSGTVVGVENLRGTIIAVVLFADFRIIIPFSEIYVEDAIDQTTVSSKSDRTYRETLMLQKLLGAQIPFVITEVSGSPISSRGNAAEYAIVASRKEAIQRIAANNFNIRRRDGVARINAGDTVKDAAIISVGPHAIFVNVAGKDVNISTYQLTYRYAPDVRELYKPGDTIDVYIRDVERDEDGKMTNIIVSAKTAEIPNFIPRLKKLSPNLRCLATITSIRPSRQNPGKTVVLLYLDSYDVPALAMYTQIDTIVKPLLTGDKVIFSVFETREDRGIVIGNIIQRI